MQGQMCYNMEAVLTCSHCHSHALPFKAVVLSTQQYHALACCVCVFDTVGQTPCSARFCALYCGSINYPCTSTLKLPKQSRCSNIMRMLKRFGQRPCNFLKHCVDAYTAKHSHGSLAVIREVYTFLYCKSRKRLLGAAHQD